MNVFLSHPKLDVLYNPLLDDSEHACKSSKDGTFVQSTLGFTSMLRTIHKWIVQKFHLWMIYKHAQNHPKVDYTKHPISDDLETCSLSSKSGLYKRSNFG